MSSCLLSFKRCLSDPQATSDQPEPEALLQTEEVSPTPITTPPTSSTSLSESPTSPAAASLETSSVKPRRRSGHSRPRPISDYGQLVSRKNPIPEEGAEPRAEERTAETSSHKDSSARDLCGIGQSPETCSINRDDQGGTRQRPVSVIGGVEENEEKEDRLPSVSLLKFLLEAGRC